MEIDACKAKLARGPFARVCIEVDMMKPLGQSTTMEVYSLGLSVSRQGAQREGEGRRMVFQQYLRRLPS